MHVCVYFFPKHLKVSLILISDVQNYGIAIRGLVTNYGKGGRGLQNGRGGGAREVLPLQKRGGWGVLAMLKGGRHKTFMGSLYVVA